MNKCRGHCEGPIKGEVESSLQNFKTALQMRVVKRAQEAEGEEGWGTSHQLLSCSASGYLDEVG